MKNSGNKLANLTKVYQQALAEMREKIKIQQNEVCGRNCLCLPAVLFCCSCSFWLFCGGVGRPCFDVCSLCRLRFCVVSRWLVTARSLKGYALDCLFAP